MLDFKISIIFLCSLISTFAAADMRVGESQKPIEEEEEIEYAPPKYQVSIKINPLKKNTITTQEDVSNLEALLKEHLSIVSKSTQPDLDEEQENYLLLETSREIEQILATEGYFNCQIKIIPKVKRYEIQIGLPVPVTVKNKLVVLSGAIEKDPNIQDYYRNIAQVWKLNPNDIFKQKLWSSSKKLAVKEIQKNKYPLATLKHSYAQIDTAKHSALLHVEIDSGEIIKFGDITALGAERYPESIIQELAGFKKGQEYQEELLSNYQQELEKEGHYREVVVSALLNEVEMNTNEVPVVVYTREQPKKSFGIELTYNSTEGFGTALEYQYYNFLKKGYVAALGMGYNRYEQQISFGVTQPKKFNGRFWTARTNYFKGSRNGLNTASWSAGFWYVHAAKATDTRLGLEYYQARLKSKEGENIGNSKVLMPTLQWKANRIQTLLRPEKGYYFSVKLGSTLGNLASTSSAQLAEVYADYYLTPWERNKGTFLFKTQAGYLSTRHPTKAPDELKFKIGGSNSVRGYPVDSIGIKKGSYTYGGTAKLAATIEYQKPVTDSVSVAVFHDIGDVKNHFRDMKLKHGTGVGVRWFSVAAPLSFDIAYGHQRKKFTWHLNLGAKF